MKASELIKELEEAIKIHGDVEVVTDHMKNEQYCDIRKVSFVKEGDSAVHDYLECTDTIQLSIR